MARRVKWRQYTDEEIHELTADQIEELTGGATVYQFESRLRSFARNYGYKCSVVNTDTGLRFRLWQVSELDSYLPSEVTEGESRLSATTAHVDCSHPATRWERKKCRRSRGQLSRKQRDSLWASLMQDPGVNRGQEEEQGL